ncbi:uncharacterized protein [Dermacentor albipictus]|uniref:uncharacterized protein isoform X1 n=1 Tax=Dermacentor albipictus TaxID=60249 RepID=UPI0038FC3805
MKQSKFGSVLKVWLSDTPRGHGGWSASHRIYHRLEVHFQDHNGFLPCGWKVPCIPDGVEKCRTAAGGRCDAAPMHHFGKAFLWQDGHDCEYAACSPSQFTQWRVFTQASEVCSWALHFAQCDPTYQHGVGR